MTAELLAAIVASAREGLRDDWEWRHEVVSEAIVALADAAAKHVCKCENGPCPKCGGGPSGEWFEGAVVRCDDCDTMLVVDNVEPCEGRSTFVLLEDHDAT